VIVVYETGEREEQEAKVAVWMPSTTSALLMISCEAVSDDKGFMTKFKNVKTIRTVAIDLHIVGVSGNAGPQT
jgi:hypothetical protein